MIEDPQRGQCGVSYTLSIMNLLGFGVRFLSLNPVGNIGEARAGEAVSLFFLGIRSFIKISYNLIISLAILC